MEFQPLNSFVARLRRMFTAEPRRRFRVAQIEVSSRCGMGCTFCAQSALGSNWISGDLPVEIYQDCIVPALDEFELVYLQGWGEPTLHPDFWSMIRMAQEKGCRTGFTSCGMTLKEAQIDRILDHGIDLLSFSFAGATAATHQALRVRSDWEALCRQTARLAETRDQRGNKRPVIEFHYLMVKDNFHELADFVSLAARLGADEVVATNLTYTPTLELDRQRVFSTHPGADVLGVIEAARKAAQETGLQLRIYPVQMNSETMVCDARPDQTVYINHLGQVSPCVYLGITVDGPIRRYFEGQPCDTTPLSFGNVCSGFESVLDGEARRAFLDSFQRRDLHRNALASFAALAGEADVELPLPPEPCRNCYKMYGV